MLFTHCKCFFFINLSRKLSLRFCLKLLFFSFIYFFVVSYLAKYIKKEIKLHNFILVENSFITIEQKKKTEEINVWCEGWYVCKSARFCSASNVIELRENIFYIRSFGEVNSERDENHVYTESTVMFFHAH